MDIPKQSRDDQRIRSVTHLAIFVNAGLFVLKLLVGVLGGSIALVADGVHSVSDMGTDLIVLFGIRISSKSPDEEHPYGHGWAETFASVIIALVLMFVGSAMVYHAAISIARGKVAEVGYWVLVIAVISVVIKELLYKITRKVAVKSHSSALYANAWHQRSDALSSVAVVVGFAALKTGFEYGDSVAAIAIGLMIIFVSAGILGNCVREFTESAADKETIERIKQVIGRDSSIRQWHKLRTRMVGREVFMDLHILVDPQLNISAAHEISESLENALDEELTRPVNITVHVEPDVPELRK